MAAKRFDFVGVCILVEAGATIDATKQHPTTLMHDIFIPSAFQSQMGPGYAAWRVKLVEWLNIFEDRKLPRLAFTFLRPCVPDPMRAAMSIYLQREAKRLKSKPIKAAV